jgi:hypothetical protein
MASGGCTPRVPTDRVRSLHDEHRRALSVVGDLVDQEGGDLGQVGAVIDGHGAFRRSTLTTGAQPRPARAAAGSPPPRPSPADVVFVDLLVVTRNRLDELVERPHQVSLVLADLTLDLDHPVRHLLADERERPGFQVVF